MNFLFYCHGDDGQMMEAFRQALQTAPFSHTLIDGHDTSMAFDRSSIDAAIVWLPPEDFFDGLTNLTHVYAMAAGVDQLLKHPGLPDSISLIRLQDAGMATQMAEYVLYGTLRAQRNFHEFDVAQRQASWVHGLPVRRSADIRVGILGAGVLGSAVASRLVLNGYPATCWSRTPKTPIEGISHAHGNDALPQFLANSNVLVCLLALTDETAGILDKSLFNLLPRGAYIINCARGQHLVDVDLLNALDEEQLSGALLDVFHHEPLADNHPFWSHPRVTVTPHEAARSLMDESVTQIMRSIGQVENGINPDGLIDPSRGY
ncbi:MAG: 2-hydroxyacid dehydrogenase [Granulosicoccus sp.]